VLCSYCEILATQSLGHKVLTSALELILEVISAGGVETVKSVIDDNADETNFKLVNWFIPDKTTLNQKDMNISIDKLQYWRTIHLDL